MIEIKGINELTEAMRNASGVVDDGLDEALNEGGVIFKRVARSRVKVRTGFTKSTIYARRVGRSALQVGAGGAARWIEYDTKPHIIRARPGKTLRFIGRGGGVVFRKFVRHPGTKGKPFIAPAIGAFIREFPGRTWSIIAAKLTNSGALRK